MTRYVNLIQTHVRRKIELISILRIICCVRSAFAYCEPSFRQVGQYTANSIQARIQGDGPKINACINRPVIDQYVLHVQYKYEKRALYRLVYRLDKKV